jgi:hypothetical protein
MTMLKKSVPTLIFAALAALGTAQIAHAQKNYTEGGDTYSAGHTKKAKPQGSAAKQGKFDPYTQGAKSSTKSDLSATGKATDPTGSAAKQGKFDPYTEGAKQGKFDPYTEGAKSSDKAQ